MRAKIIAIGNEKGGVGKTVTAVNVAVGLAAAGKKVLVADFDPQANASSYLGFGIKNQRAVNMATLIDNILKGNCIEYDMENEWNTDKDKDLMQQLYQTMRTAVVHNKECRVDLIPSTIILAGAEITLISSVYRKRALKIILSYFIADYDYIIIDSSPTLGTMLVNALVASDEVIIPIQAEEFAVDGIVQMINTVQKIRRAENHTLQIAGFLLTMVQTNVIEFKDIKQDMIEQFGNLVFTTTISRAVEVSRSTKHHKPIASITGSKVGAQYKELVHEYLSRQEDRR